MNNLYKKLAIFTKSFLRISIFAIPLAFSIFIYTNAAETIAQKDLTSLSNSIEEFDKLVAEGSFLEYANVFNNKYGTLASSTNNLLEKNFMFFYNIALNL